MKLNPMDLGVCGVEQVFYAGSVSFDTDGASAGVAIGRVPANTIITGAVAVVRTAFNAATTNVLTIGTNGAADNIFGADDIKEDSAGPNIKNAWLECEDETEVKAKYAQTGDAATAGKADVFLKVVRCPD